MEKTKTGKLLQLQGVMKRRTLTLEIDNTDNQLDATIMVY
jgi:hypothetical protein